MSLSIKAVVQGWLAKGRAQTERAHALDFSIGYVDRKLAGLPSNGWGPFSKVKPEFQAEAEQLNAQRRSYVAQLQELEPGRVNDLGRLKTPGEE